MPNLIPNPAPMQPQSRAYDLKSRLDWGEPALTIIDIRPIAEFNQSHIQGAISLPVEELVARAPETLEMSRDIYVYSDSDEETAAAAAQLREAGYANVSELTGGLAAWKAVGYPVEAISGVSP
ncbi:MAG: rhodanese-like domain-containing protein [Microcoleaceae cyanobacterium]